MRNDKPEEKFRMAKCFKAPTIEEAMSKVRLEFGADAVIIETRTYKVGGFLGFFGKKVAEVIATKPVGVVDTGQGRLKVVDTVSISPDAQIAARTLPTSNPVSSQSSPGISSVQTAIQTIKNTLAARTGEEFSSQTFSQLSQSNPPLFGSAQEGTVSAGDLSKTPAGVTGIDNTPVTRARESVQASISDARLAALENAIGEIMKVLRSQTVRNDIQVISGEAPTRRFTGLIQKVYDRLIEAEVSQELATNIATSLLTLPQETRNDWKLLKAEAIEKIASMITVSGPITFDQDEKKCKIVALVGPTGVGKTTTLAKLASRFVLQERKEVAFVTVDTYRVAALDQLRTYGEILSIPVEIVYKPHEFRKAIEKWSSRDLILIDTAGRSQRNTLEMLELKSYLSDFPDFDVHLVACATTKYSDLLDITRNFGKIRFDKIIFTKLDETNSCGSLLNVATEVGRPISYVTCGQNVPDDIAVADARDLARRIMEDET